MLRISLRYDTTSYHVRMLKIFHNMFHRVSRVGTCTLLKKKENARARALNTSHKKTERTTNQHEPPVLRSKTMSNILAVATPDSVKEYKSVLCRFMAFKHGRPYSFTTKGRVKIDAYPHQHEFTQDELVAIKPRDVTQWLCLLAYHNSCTSKG